MITGYLREFHEASRKEIDGLLWGKLSEALDDSQKKNKIGNLLSDLRLKGRIYNSGSKAKPMWRLRGER
jgi:ATP-dependent DNA helicase RecG